MIQKIIDILSNMKNIDGWKINVHEIQSKELFFVKRELDMNRGKNVQQFLVTIYKDFSEGENKFKGSSSTKLSPGMNDDDIRTKLEEAAFSASFVKNEYYPLVKAFNNEPNGFKSNFSEEPLSEFLPKLTQAIFKADNKEKGFINSAELFLNKATTRIINSEGVDVSFEGYNGQIEFITNWDEGNEEVELFKDIKFSDYEPKAITDEVEKMLTISKERAQAHPTPSLKNHTILLTGEPVKRFLKYYYFHSNAKSVYEKMSTTKLNENIQGEDIKGDIISMKLDPSLRNSSFSTPYDQDGYPLKEVTIYDKGVLKNYWGANRYASYLNIETTGDIHNIVIEGGSKSINEFKSQPYIELLEFSDFQMNPLTGNFSGEIRLGRYFDGEKTIPVTGGSISGLLKDVQSHMYFSKELQQSNNFVGPETIQLFGLNISGN